MHDFYVGQKVVCINDDVNSFSGDQKPGANIIKNMHGLKKGEIYTIRWVGYYENANFNQYLGIKVKEIIRKNEGTLSDDNPYNANRFKPLEGQKDSLEQFRKLLNPDSATIEFYQNEYKRDMEKTQ